MNKKEIERLIKEEITKQVTTGITKQLLADFIENEYNEIGDTPLYQNQPLDTTLNFLKNGRPSPLYMKAIISKLQELGFEIDEDSMTAAPPAPFTTNFSSETNPYIQPGGRPSRGGYTGD